MAPAGLPAHGKPTTGGDMADPRMEGTITIRLRIRDLPPSGLPDLAFDADWLRRELPKLTYKKSIPIPDKRYELIECAASVSPEVPGAT
jgi:hypothetical protein